MNNIKVADINTYQVAETYMLNLIRNEHPEWVEEDGTCERCEKYYMSLDKMVVLDQ